MHFYFLNAYRYVRPVIPLPNPFLLQTLSVDCEPRFFQEALTFFSAIVIRKHNDTNGTRNLPYLTKRLFTYDKHYTETVIQNGMQSDRQQSNKLILFNNV